MNPRFKSALISGVVVGVVAALLHPAGAGDIFITVGGLLNGLLAAYLYLFWRPSTSKSLYGDGAVVGLLAGPVGGVAAALVLTATGETEHSAAILICVCVAVYSMLGPVAGLLGMAIFRTQLALDNSKASKIVAVLGSALIYVGVFLPVVTIPLVGPQSMVFFVVEVHWLGLLAPLMATLAIILVKIGRVKLCWIPGLLGVYGVLWGCPGSC